MEKLTLGEIGNVLMCKRILKEQTSSNGDIPFFKISTFGDKADTFISREIYEEYKQKFSYPKKGDVLISAAGTIGKTVVFDGQESYFQDSNIVWLDNDETIVLNSYLYYFYQTKPWVTTNESIISRLYNSDIKAIKIQYPPLQTQQKIAHTLSILDRKIALNRQINAKLEEMAKTLYDYWFVQFDFPNSEGKPYRSSGGEMVWCEELKREVPKGWECGTLDNLGQIVGGSTPSTADPENFSKNAIAWITPNDLSNNQGNKFISHGAIDVSEQGIKSASLKIYPKGTVLLSSRAPVGYMAIAENELTTNQGFKSFIPNKGYSEIFIYYVIKNLIPVIEQNSSGSTFKEISATALKNIQCLLPEKNMVELFVEKMKCIFEQQNALEKQTQKLTQLRDFLLPMLMNGQVSVM